MEHSEEVEQLQLMALALASREFELLRKSGTAEEALNAVQGVIEHS